MGTGEFAAARADEESSSCFFVSYSHKDKAYVSRLVGHLRMFDLPTWFDADLEPGDRWVRTISRRIRHALAVIVVMSPAANDSEWVEREILEGQRHDRQFLPVLVAGNQFFLLGSTQYFDALDGALPGDRVIRQFQRIRDAHQAGAGPGPSLVLPERRPPLPAALSVQASLAKLRAALTEAETEGRTERADILTTSLILDAVKRLDIGWLRRTDGKDLPLDLLAGIDETWSEFSGGTQGFRAQLSRHRSHPQGAPAGRQRDFFMLALALGWKVTQHDISPRYGAFVRPPDHHFGFFPTLRNPQLERHVDWHDQWVATVMAVHLQLRRSGW